MSHVASIEHKGSSNEIAIQKTLTRERWNGSKRMKPPFLFFLVPCDSKSSNAGRIGVRLMPRGSQEGDDTMCT